MYDDIFSPLPLPAGPAFFSDPSAFLSFSRGFLLIHVLRIGLRVVRASGILLQAVASGSGLSWLLWAVARVRRLSPVGKSRIPNGFKMSKIILTKGIFKNNKKMPTVILLAAFGFKYKKPLYMEGLFRQG